LALIAPSKSKPIFSNRTAPDEQRPRRTPRGTRRAAQSHDRIITTSKEQAAELKKLTDEIKAANSILDAKDEADAKKRDREDAAAIRNGASPEDVAAKRAQDDQAVKFEKIDRDLKPAAEAANKAFRDTQTAQEEIRKVKGMPDAKREDIEAAETAAREKDEEFKRRKDEYDRQLAIAREQRRGIREETTGKVEDLGAEKSTRLRQEADTKAKAEARAAEQAQRQAEAERRRAQQAEERRTRGVQDDAGDALGIARDIRGAGGNASQLEQRAKAAMSNPSQANQDELEKILDGILNHLERQSQNPSKGVDPRKLKEIERKVEILEQRIRNS
jgi:hypothetical protein